MMQGILRPSLKPENEFVNLYRRIECPICLQHYNDLGKAPKIICQSNHTICFRCFNGIARKAVDLNQHPLCPLCRKLLKLPLSTNLDLHQLASYVCVMNDRIDGYRKTNRQLDFKVFKLQRDAKTKDKEAIQLKKKANELSGTIQILKMELNSARNRNLKESVRQGPQKGQKAQKQAEREYEIDGKYVKKAPLKWFCQDMPDQKHLSLAKKQYTKIQMQYLVMYDTSQLVELNLSFNRIGNQGLTTLSQQADFLSLQILKLCNNQITELPDMRKFCQLQQLALGNHVYPPKQAANVLKQESMGMLLQHKWEKLTYLGVQLDNDKMWDKDQFIQKFTQQMPNITKIVLTQFVTRITKTRCKVIYNALNLKAKRSNHKKIKVINSF